MGDDRRRERSAQEYRKAPWRLVRSGPADGATNMAVDEAILRAVAQGLVPPTLRLYAWEPPSLSLGRAQPVADADREALAEAGLGLVRRPTGGRAILHIDELTYSVAAPEDDPRVAGGIIESYRRLSAALAHALTALGVADLAADRRAERRHSRAGPVCFELPSDYEITAGGRKLVGSAQMRALGAVLQHGALPLCGDITRICRFLSAHPDPERVRARATNLEQVLGRRVTWDEAALALEASFAEVLNLALQPGDLTAQELAWASELRAEKYGSEAWTCRQ